MNIETDLTAVIPTYERHDLLPGCLAALMKLDRAPARILVSEGSDNDRARQRTAEIVQSFGQAVELLPPPPNGQLCGNRNHLVRSVETELLVMVDDDLAIHEQFVNVGLDLLRTGQVEIVTQSPEPLWFTFRGFWRTRKPGEAYGISLRCVIGTTRLFRDHPFDEELIYGSEELDFSLALGNIRVVTTTLTPTDNSEGEIARYSHAERRRLANDSRVLVGVRRYWSSRPRLALFLALELGASILGRTPFPRQCHPGQWAAAAKELAGARATRP